VTGENHRGDRQPPPRVAAPAVHWADGVPSLRGGRRVWPNVIAMSDETTPDRSAVLIPGRTYGPSAPLLMYAGNAAEARGARLHAISWPADDGSLGSAPSEVGRWVCTHTRPALERMTTPPLLIGKSLGTHAAALAADENLPAVWLTPVLTSDWVVDALRRSEAPFLLAGGTVDRFWDGKLARSLTPYVLEVSGADHGMYVPGPLAGSAAALGRVATAVEDFLDEVVWP
jgi:hypothetical protein